MSEETKLFFHKTVLINEVLEYLALKPGGIYMDATFGSGGHTRAILEKDPTCTVIAFDWDSVSLETYGPPLQEEFPGRLRLVWGNFALMYKLLRKEKIEQLDGILADFGTSQMQITQRPGFSIYKDTDLDMRMSPSHQKVTAYEIVNKSSEEKLREIFWEYGEERFSNRIAQAIILERSKGYIKTTAQLAKIVERVVPQAPGKRKIHPATRVFQALRIFVNKELDNISAFLAGAVSVLKPDGRLVCISFHSLEDRIVKQFFKEKEQVGILEVLTPRVVTATEEELVANPSSRSACLRAAQRVSGRK